MTVKGKFSFIFSGIEPEIDEYAVAFYYRNKTIFDPLFQSASDFSNMDLKEILQNAHNQSTDTLTTQIRTYTYGVAMSDILQQDSINPTMVAGFSLGVYAALASARIVSFENGLAMVKKAYEVMCVLSEQNQFGMSAIVGLAKEDITNIITAGKLNTIALANTLSETCTIYSGKKEELELLHQAANTLGCLNAVSLEVDIPYHHPQFLKNATNEFNTFIDKIEWKESFIPVISSITQELLVDIESIKYFIAQNLSQPINWQKVIEKIKAENNEFIAECGPGLTLTRNGRFIDADLKYINIKNIKKKLDL